MAELTITNDFIDGQYSLHDLLIKDGSGIPDNSATYSDSGYLNGPGLSPFHNFDLSSLDFTITNPNDVDNDAPVLNSKGKLEGIAMRVPTPNVSIIELVFCTKKEIDVVKINNAFEIASKNKLKNILEVSHEKLVSIDFNHHSASAIVDASLTNVVGSNMGKISAWYDNEWGFSNRMCDIAETLHKIS